MQDSASSRGTGGAGQGDTASRSGSRPLVLAATILASAMAFIDGSVVTIALPAIGRGLSADLASLQWVVNGYTLMLGALILVGGGLGDRIGRRRIFLAGLIVFALASLGCAVAPTIGTLIAARVVQGVGAAFLVPQSLAIISATFPREVRGAAIGTWAAASAMTTALGPPIGGFLVDTLSWRAAFWVNLPLSVGALLLTLGFVPESRDPATGRIDWLGATLAVVALAGLTYGLTELSKGGEARVIAAFALAAGVALSVAFVLAERRAANPVMPPSLFRSRVFTGTNIVTVLLYGSLAGILFLLPFELINRRGLTAAEVGLTMLPLGLIIGLLSRPAGRLADRIGPRLFLTAGPIGVGLGAVGLASGLPNFVLGVGVPIALMSFGMAAVVSPLTTAVMTSVPDEQSGAASGVNNSASRVAGLMAVAVLGALASWVFARAAPAGATFGALPPGDAASAHAFGRAYGVAMGVAAAWSFLAAGSAWLTIGSKGKDDRAEP